MRLPHHRVASSPAWSRVVGNPATVAVAIGLAFGSFFVLRYQGLWSETDTATFVGHAENMLKAGRIDSPGSYPHGYAYSLWLSASALLTGQDVSELQREYLPIVGNLLLAIFGYVAFKALLRSPALASLSTGVLFLVPELYFTVSRGNHEKLTISMTLIALLALVTSYSELAGRRRWRVFAAWVVSFYVTLVTLASLNVLFGSSLIVGITLTVTIAAILSRLRKRETARLHPMIRRMALASLASWLLVALVMFFVYPRAANNLLLLDDALKRVAALMLTVSSPSDPYSVVQSDWSGELVYRLLSSFRWVLLVGSFLTWLAHMLRFSKRLDELRVDRILLLALYGAFGVQVAIAVLVDLLGMGAGTNLQVRMYSYFALFSAPVFVVGLVEMFRRLPDLIGRAVRWALPLALVLFTVLSITKATLEPAVSNRWLFFWQDEMHALEYVDSQLEHGVIWTGADARLSNALRTQHYGEWALNRNSLTFEVDSGPRTTHAIWSPVTELAGTTRGLPAPIIWLEDQVYDNGDARIHHRIPRTPFQR